MNKMLKNISRITALTAFTVLMFNNASAAQRVVNATNPNALAVTSNDVFWTSNVTNPNGLNYTEILRTSKDSWNAIGGNVIFRQEKNTPIAFNSLVHAEVAGVPYIYYVVNFDDLKVSYINRIPASGGPVTGITRPLYMGSNDLKTDGSFLYWADREAIRKIPINGGTATILARVPQAAYVKQVALDSNYVYFNSGASGESIYRVPKAGGAATIQAITTSTITDLYVHQGHRNPTIYWSEMNGAEKSYTVGANAAEVYQDATSDRKATSVAYDGLRVLWSECPRETIYGDCSIHEHQAGKMLILDLNAGSSDNAKNIVADPTQLFWSDNSAVNKYVHPAPLTVSINPAPVYKETSGPKGKRITAIVNAEASGGDPYALADRSYPYNYSWSISNGDFRLTPSYSPSPTISASLREGETRRGLLTLTVTDALGRTATVRTSVEFYNPVDSGGQPE